MTSALRLFFLSPPSRHDAGEAGRRDRVVSPSPASANGVPDQLLLERLRMGSLAEAREAFEALYRRHTPTLFAATLHRGGNGDVARTEDAVQAVMIRVWERRAELPEIEDVQGYLIRATARQCLDAQRTVARAHVRDATALTMLTPEGIGADEQMVADERSTLIINAVMRLPGRTGELFRAWWLSDESSEAVAARFGVSVKALYQARLRAIAQLRNDPTLAAAFETD